MRTMAPTRILYSAAVYKLRFMNISTADIAEVEQGVKNLMCKTSSVHTSVPDLLKYGTRGGMKWERWPDKVNIERLGDVMMILMNGGKEATLLRAEFDRLQMWVGSKKRAMGLQSGHKCTDADHTNLWSAGLWQWMVHPLHELSLQGRQAGPEYTHIPGDFAIQESGHIEPGDRAHLRTARWRWRIRMASELVACDGNTLLPLWWPNQSIATQDPAQSLDSTTE